MTGSIIAGHQIRKDASIDCDVVVVGSGSGGGAAAARLAENGLAVVVLEEGGSYTQADFSRSLTETLPKLYRDAGFSIIHGKPDILFQEGRCVGGSTVMNGGMAWRPPERTMERWRREHGLGFMSPQGMEPYLSAAETSIHVDWQHPDSLSPGDILFRDSAESLGFTVRLNRRAQRNCRGSSVCILGCPDNRKQAVHNTYIPRALAAGARVYADSRVEKVLTRGGRASGVVAAVIDRQDRARRYTLEVRARAVFLACGALQTPAVLRRSRLANGAGRVGQNFLCHPNIKVLGIYDRDIFYWKGVHQGYQIHQFLDEGILLTLGGVPPSVIGASLPCFGRDNLLLMEQYNRMLLTSALIEDTTSGTVTTLPGGRIWPRYRIDDLQLERMRKAAILLSRIQLNAGARRVLLPFFSLPEIRSLDEVERIATTRIRPSDVEVFTVHAMGTCAMGADPRRHVVRPSGETWEVERLYIGDASVLPTSPSINPQVTIQALALRTADQLLEGLGP